MNFLWDMALEDLNSDLNRRVRHSFRLWHTSCANSARVCFPVCWLTWIIPEIRKLAHICPQAVLLYSAWINWLSCQMLKNCYSHVALVCGYVFHFSVVLASSHGRVGGCDWNSLWTVWRHVSLNFILVHLLCFAWEHVGEVKISSPSKQQCRHKSIEWPWCKYRSHGTSR